jgi:hypothetical protein
MQRVSETFPKVVGVSLAIVAIVAGVLFVNAILPASHVKAENAGTVGIQTTFQLLGSNVLSFTSPVLPDNESMTHFVLWCSNGWQGTITARFNPPGSGAGFFQPLKTGIGNGDTSCHKLQLGGYYPNLSVIATGTSGTVSAWYLAGSAPIPDFPPAISTTGPASVPVCDKNKTATVGSGASGFLSSADSASSYLHVCGATISFAGATAAGTVSIGWDIDNSCANAPVYNFVLNTTASTPQTIPLPNLNFRSTGGASSLFVYQNLCVNNASGASLKINYSYASLSANSL